MRAVMRAELRTRTGELVATRSASNAVDGDLLAKLFAGRGKGITHMAVGTSDAPRAARSG